MNGSAVVATILVAVLDSVVHGKSFATVVSDGGQFRGISQSTVVPTMVWDLHPVPLNEEDSFKHLDYHKHSLFARIALFKRPWKLTDLEHKLFDISKLQNWKLISMEKCYFQVLLFSKTDRNCIWAWG